MIIEYAGIHRKAKNPCKNYPFFCVQSYSCTCTRNKYLCKSEFVWNVNKQVMLKVISFSTGRSVCVSTSTNGKICEISLSTHAIGYDSGEWVIFPCDNLKYHIQFHEQMDNWHLISDTKNLSAKLSWGGPFQVVWLVGVGQITSARER